MKYKPILIQTGVLTIGLLAFFFGSALIAESQSFSGGTGTIPQLDQFKATTTPYSAITTNVHAKNLYFPFSTATTSRMYATTFCINNVTPDCITAWPSGGSGGTGNVATSSAETAGYIPFWTSTAGTPALLSGGVSGFTWNNTFSRLTFTNGSSTNIGAVNSAGIDIHSGNGTIVGNFGSANSANTLFYGGVNIDGATRIATSITGIIKATAGALTAATADVDYQVPLTFGDGLTRTVNDVDCDTASGSVFGCLSSADWTTFNNKFTLPSLTLGSVLFSDGSTIAQDNANFFWDDTQNNLGIGSSSPYAKLAVQGSSDIRQLVVKGNGTQTSNLAEFQNSSGTNVFTISNTGLLNSRVNLTNTSIQHTNNNSNLTLGGVTIAESNSKDIVLTPFTNGKVGIGTSSPQSLLHVANGFSGGLATDTTGLTIENSAGTSLNFQVPAANSAGIVWGSPGDPSAAQITYILNSDIMTIGTYNTGGDIAFVTGNGGEVVRILDTGNFGIGTSSPYARLSVKGAGTGTGVNFQTTNSSNTPLFTILDNGNVGVGTSSPTDLLNVSRTATNSTGGLTLTNQSTAGWGAAITFVGTNSGVTSNTARIYSEHTGASANGTLTFQTLASGTLGTRFALSSVGAASFTPASGVGSEGAVSITVAAEPAYSLRLKNTTYSASLPIFSYYTHNDGSFAQGTDQATDFKFYTNGAGTTRMTITSGGNVGIGTTTPFATLAVNPIAGAASNAFVIGSSSATTFIVNNAGRVGIASTSPSEILGVVGNALVSGTVQALSGLITNVSASLSLTISGMFGIDSTDDQFQYRSGANTRVLSYKIDTAFVLATTTLGTGTTTIKTAGFAQATSFVQFGCIGTGGGTFNARIGDGTASTSGVVSATGNTTTFTALASNNTFTSGEAIYFEIGNVSGTVSNPSCSYQKTITGT